MKITFCGAARTVTGSQHLIEVNGQRILLDCGLFQGHRTDTYARNHSFIYDPATVHVLVLSHAHIDHSGNIPNLARRGFKGDIICTSATRDLAATMLMDSAHIQEDDVEFLNKKRAQKGEPPVPPLYTQDDVRACLGLFSSQEIGRPRLIANGVTCTLYEAGHMLGSTFVVLDIEDHDTGKDVRLVFSGDLGRRGLPILRDPSTIDRADVLLLESTYGDRLHPPLEDDVRAMEHIIAETYKRGGNVIIPAFAVGRTQQVVYALHQLVAKGDLPNVPVYVDSPLAIDVTSIFRLHSECYDEEILRFLNESGARDPFGFERLIYTRTTEESKRLNFLTTPAVIISASGMAEAGRVLHHLKNNIENPKNTVLIVGFQAENTLGRRIADGEKTVRIFGESYENRAQVEVLQGFSGHADRADLLEWVGAMSQKPKRTFLVHGEDQALFGLQSTLQQHFQIDVTVPEWKQVVSI
ncbi:MAG: MBL fold metallo-hydrolase [Anaerolineae bacterium]